SVPTNPSRALAFNVNGSSRSSNNTRIDGASSTVIQLPHIVAYVPSLESIETVNVVTNSFDAEQGQFGGAVGGPIRKDKLFYFLAYEGTTDREAASRFGTVPTAAIKSGDMSDST